MQRGFSRLFTGAVATAALLGFMGCATSNRVTMGDVKTVVGNFTIIDDKGNVVDPLEKEKIEYLSTKKPEYDSFFKSSAQMRAALVVSQVFATSLSGNLKKFYRNHEAAKQTDQNAAEITDEQAIAALKEKKSELTKEEVAYLSSSVLDLGLLTAYLGKIGEESVNLTQQGVTLAGSAKTDFTGADAAKLPSVVDGITGAQSNLKEAGTKAPEVLKELTRLSVGVSSLL